MVHDRVDHDAVGPGQLGHVVPVAQTGIHRGVVDRVEARVGTVERREERQDVHPFVHPVEPRAQDVGHRGQRARPQTIGIRDELDLVFH